MDPNPPRFAPTTPALSPEVTPQSLEGRIKAREAFLTVMSHELRTPLNGVLGMLGLLEGTSLDGAQKTYVKAARESGEHLLNLVNALLDYAKIEAGRLDLERAPTRIPDLVQSAVELLSPRAHEKGIEISWSATPDLPEYLTDEGRLRQILYNLIGNAIKFTETGGVMVRVSQDPSDKMGMAWLNMEVTDTGPGIPTEAQELIFEEFGQADTSHASRYGGAGLGLTVVKRLVEALSEEGQIQVTSTPGAGATFHVKLFLPVQSDEPKLVLDRTNLPDEVTLYTQSEHLEAVMQGLLRGTKTHLEIRSSLSRYGKRDVGLHLIDQALSSAPDQPLYLPVSPQTLAKSLILLRPEERGLIDTYRALGVGAYLIKPLRPESVYEQLISLETPDRHPDRVRPNLKARPDGPTPPSEDERIKTQLGAGVRVLLVEDNPVNALLAQTMLRHEGCEVERAATGEEALTLSQAAPFDLILMDMRMPGLDGPNTTRKMREMGITTPICALTANAFEEDRKICLASGMDDFLAKPVSVTDLKMLLSRWTNAVQEVNVAP